MPGHVAMIRQHKYYKWLYYKWLSFPFLKKAATIHCTTVIEADTARRLLGDRLDMAIVPNGIEAGRIKQVPIPPKNALIIGYVGRISHEKGINGFIRAWLKCKEKHDKMIVAGSGAGEYFKEFKHLQKMSGGAVLYEGYIDEAGVEELITKSHFLILPSGIEGADVRENFGNAVAEALALGRPVMVTRGLSWDHIEDKGIGFLFDRNNDSVCDAIKKAQKISSSALNQMAGAAYNYAVENLEASVLANKLWDKMSE